MDSTHDRERMDRIITAAAPDGRSMAEWVADNIRGEQSQAKPGAPPGTCDDAQREILARWIERVHAAGRLSMWLEVRERGQPAEDAAPFLEAFRRVMLVADPADVKVIVENANGAVLAERSHIDATMAAALSLVSDATEKAATDYPLTLAALRARITAIVLAERDRMDDVALAAQRLAIGQAILAEQHRCSEIARICHGSPLMLAAIKGDVEMVARVAPADHPLIGLAARK